METADANGHFTALTPNADYRIAVSDFLFRGGDNYTMLGKKWPRRRSRRHGRGRSHRGMARRTRPTPVGTGRTHRSREIREEEE
ncbi:5'-nucleotidase C-terminal domain-containing protein, partial [Desulfovibrio sp. DV]|uniref:5'-nucleotidase C-terminal domain-containing protein n=1 Tax=Desulfovibrio sp. DV TaxID=1844708 RepID=UPI0020C9C384